MKSCYHRVEGWEVFLFAFVRLPAHYWVSDVLLLRSHWRPIVENFSASSLETATVEHVLSPVLASEMHTGQNCSQSAGQIVSPVLSSWLWKSKQWTLISLQVINAALALAAKPQSKLAQENMDLFKEQWEKQVRVLTDAVDDITSIDDFLAVSGNELVPQRNLRGCA